MPNFSNRTQGPSRAAVPGDPSVSGAGRAAGKGFPAFLDHVPIYTPLSAPTPPPGWPTLPHARIPAEPRSTFSKLPPHTLIALPTTRLGPGDSLSLDSPTPHPLLPVSKALLGSPAHRCPHPSDCPVERERRLLEGRG